jgi:hypothetical protein
VIVELTSVCASCTIVSTKLGTPPNIGGRFSDVKKYGDVVVILWFYNICICVQVVVRRINEQVLH